MSVTTLVERVARVPGVKAVTLGGSRARGMARPDSDWDFGLYYRGSIDTDAIRELGYPGQVVEPGEWGRIVNGGAWLEVDGERVDLFVGETRGVVVPEPRGGHGFGWDPVFQPDGSERTFAEMGPEEKMRFGMRRKALDALRGWLETNPESE